MGASESAPVQRWSPSAMYEHPGDYEDDIRAKIRHDAAPGLDLDDNLHDTNRYPDGRALKFSRPEENPSSRGQWRRQDQLRRLQCERERLQERVSRDTIVRPVPGATAAHARRRMDEFRVVHGYGQPAGQMQQQQKQQEQHRRRERQSPQQDARQQQHNATARYREGSSNSRQQRSTSKGKGHEQLPTYEEATTESALMNTAVAASRGQLNADGGVVPSYDETRRPRQRSPQPAAMATSAVSPLPRGHRRPGLDASFDVSSGYQRLTADALKRRDELESTVQASPPLRRSTYSLISELREEDRRHARRTRREREVRPTNAVQREAAMAYANW